MRNAILPLAVVVRSEEKASEINIQNVIQVIGGALFIALCAQIRIPLSFSIVPITLQTLAVMLVGGALGSKKGALAVLAYLGQIAIGLPVLAGGLSNPLAFFGPSGGYIIGWVIQAYLVGLVFERQDNFKISRLLAGLIVAFLAEFSVGVLWLGQFVGWQHVLMMGFYPFILGEAIKIAAVLLYFKKHYRRAVPTSLC
jgi:biotin transport system substrate-specific component